MINDPRIKKVLYGGDYNPEQWLKKKYRTLDELNRVWDTAFWGHTFYDWDEIVVPNLLSEHFAENRTTFQGISLDYRRFNSESMLDCFKGEYEAIRSVDPDTKITTNLMGFYKPLDYQMWADSMDFTSWDNYPANEDSYSRIAMNHDLMRGIKGGQPFVLMEQTPSVTNWLPYNALKRPGVMRLWSYQAMAHGADAVMFFQMRRSIGACEKFHGAVIDHVGTENTRVFRELSRLGKELQLLCDLMHPEGAKELAQYQEDFYAGTPVITENPFGKGKAYYVGTRSDGEFYREFIRSCMEEKEIFPVLETPDGVEGKNI